MLLVICVDLDDDVGRETGLETPIVGRDAVEAAAVALATADPEDSDVNVLFQGLRIYDTTEATESVEIAIVTGNPAADVSANRELGAELDTVLAGLSTGEPVRAVVVTDGAQDESVIPVIRSRVPIDGVRRVVVRQAENLESMYYTIKQVLDDPETRGTILIPLGILLLIYPIAVVAEMVGLPGTVLGVASAMLGLYFVVRGIGLGAVVDSTLERMRGMFFAGRVTVITSVVALMLLVLAGLSGLETLDAIGEVAQEPLDVIDVAAAVIYGSIIWIGAAGVVSSLGRITDAYLAGQLQWRYFNAPVYVIAIVAVLHAVSGFILGYQPIGYVAVVLTVGTIVGLVSTLTFAIAESRRPWSPDPDVR